MADQAPARRWFGRASGEAGGATLVEFLAASLGAIAALLAVGQMAIWVWARNVAVTAAHEGARVAAESGRQLDEGSARAEALLRDGLGASASAFSVEIAQEGSVVGLEARGDAPRIVPFLPSFPIAARATAFDEDEVFDP